MSDEWVLVPKVPTEAMKRAAFGPILHGGRDGPITADRIRQAAALITWDMMLAAAPSPPVSVEQAGKTARATAEMVEEARTTLVEATRFWLSFEDVEAAINAALKLSVSPVQETKEEAR